jgi:hypothetical protein
MFAADTTLSEWVQILTAVGTFLTVVVSGLAALLAQLAKIKGQENAARLVIMDDKQDTLSKKQDVLSDKHDETAVNIQKIETATNSMKDALVKATADASFAAGVTQGLKQDKDAIQKQQTP